MTPIESKLKELENLDKKATPGPWVAVGFDSDICGPYNRVYEATGSSSVEVYADRKHHIDQDEENAILIATYRNETPKLIKALREAVSTLHNIQRMGNVPGSYAATAIKGIEKILNGGK